MSRNVRWNSDGSPVTPWSEERHRDEVAVTVVSPFPSLVPWTTGTFSSAKEFVFRRTASEVLPSLKRLMNYLSFLLLLRLFLFQNSNDIVGTFPPTGYCSNICLLSDRAFYPNKGTRRKKKILGIQKCPLTLSSSYLPEGTSFISIVRPRRRSENRRLRFFDPCDSMEVK